MFTYKVQTLHVLKPKELKRKNSAIEILDWINNAAHYLENVIFSNELIFRTSGKINCRNVRIRNSEQPNIFRDHVRDSEKENV